MKRIIILSGLVAVALLSGVSCKQDGKKTVPPVPAPVIDTLRTETFTEVKDIELKRIYHVDYSLSAEYVTDDRLAPVVLDSMNCAIAQALFGVRNPQVKALAIAKEADVREWFEDGIWEDTYPEEGEDIDGIDFSELFTDGSWQLSGEFGDEAPEGFLNYNVSGSDYMFGAAHGYYYFAPVVIELRTGCRLREEQLFKEDYREGLAQLLFYYLEQSENYEDGMLLWDEGIYPNNNFLLTADGISYFYNPYEITAYAYGLIQVDIPASALKPLLSDQYATIWN